MARGKYVQRIIDFVYSKGCVKKQELIDLLVTEFGITRSTADAVLRTLLFRLSKRGILARPYWGYYCRPSEVRG